MKNNCILVFIKYPQAGKVKTRLGKVIGEQVAAQLYKKFVEDILAIINRIKIKSFIFFSPVNYGNKINEWLGNDIDIYPQQGENLGKRMAHAFDTIFRLGYNKVVLIGSDIPDIPGDFINKAFEILEKKACVIGPARDGGYYLIGFRRERFKSVVFDDIEWSKSDVYQNTILKFNKANLDFENLPIWSDVDDQEDLIKFIDRNCYNKNLKSLVYIRNNILMDNGN